MRLLNVKTLQLEQFFGEVGDGVPEYAILSHTWGAEEVSFSEYINHQGLSNKGYEKILGCCKLADSEGFQHIWVDTCCIDKSSSVELSESINSMFQWYRNSRICYAYLSDVDSSENPSTKGSSFIRSHWFTRGWTLQELLAPVEVIFLGSDWQEIGSKSSLCSVVSRVTGIEKAALEDGSWIDYSVAQKMSWAAGRQTTRLEDRAYSLMGLFDVNMPLLYGEGKKAFTRLQQEILKQTDDQSIFAWSIPEEMHSHVHLSGLIASTPEDFKDASMVERLGSEEDYENPFQLENRLVRLRLQMVDQVRAMRLQKIKGATQRYDVTIIEQDGAEGGVGLLRPPSPSGPAKTELAERNLGTVGNIEIDEHQSTPTIAITEALQWETGEIHFQASSLDDPSDEFPRKFEASTFLRNPDRLKNEKVKTSSSMEAICEERWRSYIYEPVIIIPLQCHIGGRQLAIILTRGSIKTAGKVPSRLHNPSVITIDGLREARLTPLTTLYAEATTRDDHKLTGIRNSDRRLEIRIASLLAAGYAVHNCEPGWEYISSRSALVETRKADYADYVFALTPLILFHRQQNLQEPSFLAEAFVLSIPVCEKAVLKCEIDVITNSPTPITARDYESFSVQFKGDDSQICVPVGGYESHDAIWVKYRPGLKLINVSIEPMSVSKAIFHVSRRPSSMTKKIRLSSEISPVLRSVREGLIEKPNTSASIFHASSQSK